MANDNVKAKGVFGLKSFIRAFVTLMLLLLIGWIGAMYIGFEGVASIKHVFNESQEFWMIYEIVFYGTLIIFWKPLARFIGRHKGEDIEQVMIEKWYLFAFCAAVVELGSLL